MKDKTVEYQKTALFIPKELHQAIKIRSAQSGETMTEIIISKLSELLAEPATTPRTNRQPQAPQA